MRSRPDLARRSGNVGMVQIRIGTTVFDTRRRPLVIALVDAAERAGAGFITAAKEAAGHGADLVATDAATVTEGLPSALAGVGVGCVGVARSVSDIDLLLARGVTALHWKGPGPFPRRSIAGPEPVWVMAASTPTPHPDPTNPSTDAVVVSGDVAALGQIPPGVVGLVDLSTDSDRAATAALVTVALSAGASGFVTTLPSAVRRAAHVIRAVEHAE